MSWMDQFGGDSLDWLLDQADPGVRYLALRDLLDRPQGDGELEIARAEAHVRGPIADILDAMHPDGYWVKPGPGYLPKYRSTVWSLISLAQLGASADADDRVGRACAYALDHGLQATGQFSVTGPPSGTVDCLQGNLCASLLALGCDPARLEAAFEWMARTVTGEGLAPKEDRHALVRYYAGKCGPLFACGAHNGTSCAWGGAKVMLAFSCWPPERRTPLVQRAIEAGVEFFLSTDPVACQYPRGYSAKPSGNWWKLGFPLFYITDVLQVAEAMVALGRGADSRLAHTLEYIGGKRDVSGRWALEYDYSGKTWAHYGAKKQPSKWVTLRALRALKGAYEQGARVA
ncbi:MAG: nitrogen fixation protein NifH [Anaerolineae bacterium]|nr:nitrogen fixation protein NifH [Anaerolineae bacterium]